MTNLKILRGTDRADRQNSAPEEYLVKLPKPTMKLSTLQRRYYKYMGEALIRTKKLQDVDVPSVCAWACYFDRFVWAQEKINELGNEEGLIQEFESGAKNISPYATIMDRAFDQLLKISRRFGLSIKDRNDIRDWADAAQLNLFDQFVKEKIG